MKFRPSVTIAFSFLCTLLFLTLFTVASNKLEQNINSQQELLITQTNTLINLKNNVLSMIINRFLTMQDILILRKTCHAFGNLLEPNDSGMITFCNYFDSQQMVNVDIFWLNLKYFLNESYENAFHEMEIYTIKEQQYAVLTCSSDQKIISWFGEIISKNTKLSEFKTMHDLKRKRESNKNMSHPIIFEPLITLYTKFNFFAQVQFIKGGIIKKIDGHEKYGGKIFDDELLPKLKKIKTIVSTNAAFAALLDHGGVFAWGHKKEGGVIPIEIENKLKNIKMIFSTAGSFCALSQEGNVFAWGKESTGGKIPDDVQFKLQNVKMIYANHRSFIALLDNGQAFTWGNLFFGGNEIQFGVQKNIKMVFTTKNAFAALLNDGSVHTWGCPYWGGRIPEEVELKLKKNVKMIFSNDGAFTALLLDGSCVSWGGSSYGGKIPKHLQSRLKNIKQIFSKSFYCGATFTAFCENDDIIKW